MIGFEIILQALEIMADFLNMAAINEIDAKLQQKKFELGLQIMNQTHEIARKNQNKEILTPNEIKLLAFITSRPNFMAELTHAIFQKQLQDEKVRTLLISLFDNSKKYFENSKSEVKPMPPLVNPSNWANVMDEYDTRIANIEKQPVEEKSAEKSAEISTEKSAEISAGTEKSAEISAGTEKSAETLADSEKSADVSDVWKLISNKFVIKNKPMTSQPSDEFKERVKDRYVGSYNLGRMVNQQQTINRDVESLIKAFWNPLEKSNGSTYPYFDSVLCLSIRTNKNQNILSPYYKMLFVLIVNQKVNMSIAEQFQIELVHQFQEHPDYHDPNLGLKPRISKVEVADFNIKNYSDRVRHLGLHIEIPLNSAKVQRLMTQRP